MQRTQIPPSSLNYPLGEEREHLAHVELNNVGTEEEVKAKKWLT